MSQSFFYQNEIIIIKDKKNPVISQPPASGVEPGHSVLFQWKEQLRASSHGVPEHSAGSGLTSAPRSSCEAAAGASGSLTGRPILSGRCCPAAFGARPGRELGPLLIYRVHVLAGLVQNRPGGTRWASWKQHRDPISRRIPNNKWKKTPKTSWWINKAGQMRRVRSLENENSFPASLCLMYGLIECLFLFLQFWLVDHTRSHWPAGWPLAFLASWHCSTDDEGFQEPHLSAQWQTLPQLLLFHPPPTPVLYPRPPFVPLSCPHHPSTLPPSHPFLLGWIAAMDHCPLPRSFLQDSRQQLIQCDSEHI